MLYSIIVTYLNFIGVKAKMKNPKNILSIEEWYSDIYMKGLCLKEIPEEERTPEMCFVAIHYWGAALEYVPEKYKTPEMCLDAVRHNTPVDEGCSSLAFVPEELKTQEMCLEAIRHDYLGPTFWEKRPDGGFYTVETDYAAAINFVPEKFRTAELCFESLIHNPSSPPGEFYFVEQGFSKHYTTDQNNEQGPSFSMWLVEPKSLTDLLNSSELFMKALKYIGMPDEYNDDAMELFKRLKEQRENTAV
jgi:hypothetical protein